MSCVFCRSNDLAAESRFVAFRTVTSDVKPWRTGFGIGLCKTCGFAQSITDENWLRSNSEIYGGYQSYYQTSDNDQVMFIDGRKSNRSDLFLKACIDVGCIPKSGAALDFGCGKGTVLNAISKIRQDLRLFGFDLDDHEVRNLQAINGFEQLFTQDLPKSHKFDLIVMSHSLEHLSNPIEVLGDLADLLTADGALAIAVPDCVADPFKLLIADHCLHFSCESLEKLLTTAGFQVVHIESNSESRELWAVCRFSHAKKESSFKRFSNEWLPESIDWLGQVREHARSVTTRKPFGIFGTSINGVWLYGELETHVDFFVDEDPARVDQKVFGRQVFTPQSVPPRASVYLPFPEPIARKIAIKLSHIDANWIIPPAFL